jgi:hypothetical protein
MPARSQATISSPPLLDQRVPDLCVENHCTPAVHRRITRWEHEHVLEAVQRRLDENPQAMRRRRETVEHPFGTIKARMGTRTRRRGVIRRSIPNSREAERLFPIRLRVAVRPAGFGRQLDLMQTWLDVQALGRTAKTAPLRIGENGFADPVWEVARAEQDLRPVLQRGLLRRVDIIHGKKAEPRWLPMLVRRQGLLKQPRDRAAIERRLGILRRAAASREVQPNSCE